MIKSPVPILFQNPEDGKSVKLLKECLLGVVVVVLVLVVVVGGLAANKIKPHLCHNKHAKGFCFGLHTKKKFQQSAAQKRKL